MTVKRVWVIEYPPGCYGIGTAFDTKKEAVEEARCWGGGEVLGPFVLAEKKDTHTKGKT